ncbi:hypothetical protein, partial [Bradyrhizobium liaoningense]|uniref:hypothetical protein n=1 Tax=Bradyrhizobium liaoningense TaxID=43992 RepID=UPI0024E197CF
NASGGSSSSSSLLIRSKNPRRCQAENPLKLLSEFAGPALICSTNIRSERTEKKACNSVARSSISGAIEGRPVEE